VSVAEDQRRRQAAVTWDDYSAVRQYTEALAAPLSAEDQTVQSMPDVSPTKWHRAHVTWFFEQFILLNDSLGLRAPRPYRPVAEEYLYLFNSYYEGVGPRHPRAQRGLLTRPGVAEITRYRDAVDTAMADVLTDDLSPAVASLVELGLHHEQQHQELLLMDIKHVLGSNPLRPAYRADLLDTPGHTVSELGPASAGPTGGWSGYDGGLVEIGAPVDGTFTFDNETPAHRVWLEPFEMADRLVDEGRWREFMADGGYQRPDLWLSDGWAAIQASGQRAPLYWQLTEDDDWEVYTLGGVRPILPGTPVVHVSYYEADAFAHWAGARLPTEAEWETCAADSADVSGVQDLFGQVWQWTASAYLPYPGFVPAPGVVGEYNGKFMVSQHVLRGSASITPAGHSRGTYRNFFPPSARWAFSGLRLAR
jgi:ergothioneine biosynthesis protein EgtB